MTAFVLSVHLLTTLMMTGLIWFVQLVHYPLFNKVSESNFSEYEAIHTFRTGILVAPLMLVELGSGFGLFWVETSLPDWVLWINLMLLAIIWLSTAFLQVPQHRTLSLGYEEKAYKTLVQSNWIRTVCWSVRSVLLLVMLFQ